MFEDKVKNFCQMLTHVIARNSHKANEICMKAECFILSMRGLGGVLLYPVSCNSHVGLHIWVCPSIHSKGDFSLGGILIRKVKIINCKDNIMLSTY